MIDARSRRGLTNGPARCMDRVSRLTVAMQLAFLVALPVLAAPASAGAQERPEVVEAYRHATIQCHVFMTTGRFEVFSGLRPDPYDFTSFEIPGEYRGIAVLDPAELVSIRAVRVYVPEAARRSCAVAAHFYRAGVAWPEIEPDLAAWIAEDARWTGFEAADIDLPPPPEGSNILATYKNCAALPEPLVIELTDFDGGPPHRIAFLQMSRAGCANNTWEFR